MINVQYINNLTAQVNAVSSCAALQAVADLAVAAINAQLASLEARIIAMEPALALITPPTNPTEVITWIENYITLVLGPQLASVAIMQAQVIQLTAALAALTAAIISKASSFTSCSISIPT